MKLILCCLFGLIHAQQYNVNTETLQTRSQWCTLNKQYCQQVCFGQGGTMTNTCDASQITAWQCICQGGQGPNGINMTAYPVPYFICQKSQQLCIKQCGQDQQCSSNCFSSYVCGEQTWDCNVAGCTQKSIVNTNPTSEPTTNTIDLSSSAGTFSFIALAFFTACLAGLFAGLI